METSELPNTWQLISAQSNTLGGEEDFLIGTSCATNDDCWTSTFCCSQGNCVPGSNCYKGQKQPNDFCDYGFECLSRCCSDSGCSDIIKCVETCKKNSDCANFACCSFGYCSATLELCSNGLKDQFDQCEADTECLSGNCVNNRCSLSNAIDSGSSQLALAVVFALIMIMITCACCLTKRRFFKSKSSDGYSRQELSKERKKRKRKIETKERDSSPEHKSSSPAFKIELFDASKQNFRARRADSQKHA